MKVKIVGTTSVKHGLISLCLVASIGGANAQSTVGDTVPLASSFDKYSVAASRGNVTAASELFEKARECIVVRNIDSRLASLQADKNSALNAPEKDGPLLNAHVDKMERAQRRADLSREMCVGSERKVSTANIYDIALTAARLGDSSASACFMASPWPVAIDEVDKSKGGQYKAAAEYLKTHMIQSGDWRFVEAMVIASAPGMRSGYAAYIQSDDNAGQLRYSKLLRLGVAPDSDEARNLDLSIRILSERLSPEDVAKADDWATDVFKRYYASQSRVTTISACDA